MRIAADTLLGLIAASSIVCLSPVAGALPGGPGTPAGGSAPDRAGLASISAAAAPADGSAADRTAPADASAADRTAPADALAVDHAAPARPSDGGQATPAVAPGAKAAARRGAGAQLEPYVETIPGTVVTFEMVPVPAAADDGDDAASAGGAEGAGTAPAAVGPFWIGRTEVTWDEYDVFALGLDLEPRERRGVDAESRPSRPYGAPDRGFGHAGFAAISVTFQGATAYARWLSEATGRTYRLPTAAEWRHACELGLAGVEAVDEHAWHAGNAGGTPHAVGAKPPDALGLVDLLGNVGEWAAGPGGVPALHGGSYRDPADAVHCGARAEQTDAWNERDPQIPKSRWWLSDGPFAGFRIVREPATSSEHDRRRTRPGSATHHRQRTRATSSSPREAT